MMGIGKMVELMDWSRQDEVDLSMLTETSHRSPKDRGDIYTGYFGTNTATLEATGKTTSLMVT